MFYYFYFTIATLIEGAERAGKATGTISTSNIQHATPADYSSHNPNRNNYEDLGRTTSLPRNGSCFRSR